MTLLKRDEKKIMEDLKRHQILSEILILISKEVLSISEIARRLNINRSTMRYYLSLLKEEKKIDYERKNNLPGRPTFVKINQRFYQKEKKEFEKKSKYYLEKMKKSPLNSKIIKILNQEKESTLHEILKKLREEDPNLNGVSEVISMLQYLESRKKIKNVWKTL